MSPDDDDRRVLVFLRSPRKGTVKTRLARRLGPELTLALYRCFVEDLMQTLGERRLPVTVCYHPARDAERVRAWLGNRYDYQAQRGGDLGERMDDAFQRVYNAHEDVRRAVLVGTDFPDLPGSVFEQAFRTLRRTDAVFGPTADGGYYLVGFRREGYCADGFRNIPWGTSTVLEGSATALVDAGRSHRLIRRWRDVDHYGDLLLLKASILSDRHTPAKRTASLLAEAGLSVGK
jgi:rSAM/selenodomain-associated transferase 1